MRDDITAMKGEIKTIKDDVNKTNGRIDALRKDMISGQKKTENQMGAMRKDIASIKMTVENDINHSMKIIAEGHFDLSRKHDEAISVNKRKEMMLLRITHLENEVRILKEKIN